MDDLARFFAHDAYAQHLGVELVDHGRGYARVRMRIGPRHLNSVGRPHGGAIFSLADAALAVAANSHGTLALAIDASVSFCRAAGEGTLIAEAREVACGARLANYRVDVTGEDQGDLIAQVQGTVYRTRTDIGAEE